jgi:hypothetical protein
VKYVLGAGKEEKRGGTLLKNNTLQVGFGKLLSLVRSQLQELQVRGQRGKVSELRRGYRIGLVMSWDFYGRDCQTTEGSHFSHCQVDSKFGVSEQAVKVFNNVPKEVELGVTRITGIGRCSFRIFGREIRGVAYVPDDHDQ